MKLSASDRVTLKLDISKVFFLFTCITTDYCKSVSGSYEDNFVEQYITKFIFPRLTSIEKPKKNKKNIVKISKTHNISESCTKKITSYTFYIQKRTELKSNRNVIK